MREPSHDFVDFLKTVSQANPMDALRTAISMLSIYDPEAADMSPEANSRKALKLMAANPSIIKRPVLEHGARLVVGFKPDVYERELAKR